MRHVPTLAQRELSVYFFSPIAYVVIAIFLIVSGIFFALEDFLPGAESSLRPLMGHIMPIILVYILPMITMRLLAEEFRSGTIETLMTAPVSVVNFLRWEGWDWGQITTAGVIIMVPVIIFSLFTHRYLISGLTAGAVKG